MPKTRLRFAPSPTGSLHIGGLRTALFNYLIAKNLGGKLILRIEDTDQKREVEGAVGGLINILKWAGIGFDEGPVSGGEHGPYVQSQRFDIYKKYAEQLLKGDGAYRCFCSPERLQKMREDQQAKKLPPRYDRKCLGLSAKEIKKKIESEETFVVRQKMPTQGEIIVQDELRGEIKFKSGELEDHVLIKSNTTPTYQFANVVDDHLMEISHVVRGEEWISSFPKNILLYKAFGWKPPKFIHIPLILNKQGGKLSKRQGDVAVEDFRQQGYLPEALISFCALLGWRSSEAVDGEAEIFTLEELEKIFKIEDIGTSPAVFDEEKLDYLNGYYIRHKEIGELVKLCKPHLPKKLKQSERFIKSVIKLEQERLKKLSEIGELTDFFFTDKLKYEKELLIWKKMDSSAVKNNLEKVYELLEKIPEENWTNDSIEDALMSYIKAKEFRVGEYLWPMRAALTGRKASPGPFDVAEVLGKKLSLERIKSGVDKL